MSAQKARDAILVVTGAGALLLLPPILPFFDRPADVFGVPMILVYVFGVWLALIAAAWALSRRLPALPPAGPDDRDAARPTALEPAGPPNDEPPRPPRAG